MKRVACLVPLLLSLPVLCPAAEPQAAAAKPAAEIPLEIRTWDGVQELIRSHKGQVVVVDLWSTSCPPCLREFPNLVTLHRKHPNQVTCISVNLNYAGLKDEPPASFRQSVLTFLRRKGATFPNVVCSTPDIDVLDAIRLASIPAVFVYGRDGKLVKRFDNDALRTDTDEFTYAKDIVPLVERLIGEK